MSSDKDRFERNWQPRLWVTIGLLIAIGGYFIAFIVGNSKKTSIDFVFGEARTSVIWLMLISALVGLMAGILLSQLHRRRQTRISEERRQARMSAASVETPEPISDADS